LLNIWLSQVEVAVAVIQDKTPDLEAAGVVVI
jgi:hypothetical protein